MPKPHKPKKIPPKAPPKVEWNILARLERLERHMTKVDDIVQQLDQATNEIAAKLDDLRNQLAGRDIELATEFDPIIARLKSLASDPTNPVPAEEPAAPAPADEAAPVDETAGPVEPSSDEGDSAE